ncbi:MAG: hypothetical protein JSU90_00850 [Nitrospiraceae bacterium]|nr:MAG: hypothetical protein JSU90_00850 [Nitrospiraceae bacterium]
MNEETGGLEVVQKRLDDLNREVDTFLEDIKHVRSMKASVVELHDQLRAHDGDIVRRKEALEKLITTSEGLMEGIREKTHGVLMDMEKKADTIAAEMKEGIARIEGVCEQGRDKMRSQQREHAEALANKYEEIRNLCSSLQTMMDSQEQKMDGLKKEYGKIFSFYEKIDSSLREMKKTVYDIQKRPYEAESRLKKAEERLEQLINEKYLRQKNFSSMLLIVVIALVVFSITAFYLRW